MNLLDTQTTLPEEEPRKWSDYQTAVFDAIRDSSRHIQIEAVAGSGKTTTIIEAMRYAEGPALFLAFNKAIAEDISGKLTSGIAKTLNALGHRALKANLPHAQLNADKTKERLISILGKDSRFMKEYGYAMQRCISAAKNAAAGIGDYVTSETFEGIIDAGTDIPAEDQKDVSRYLVQCWDQLLDDKEEFDFDDQLYWPVYYNWDYDHYPTVMVDECQDLSPIQHLMLSKFAADGSRIIAVGDRFQAIYGFRGALHDSMDRLRERFDMKELPLSISYRCAQRIIENAQMICPSILPRPGAPEGIVHWMDDIEDPELFSDTMIVCRNNAPLFKAIMKHVRAGEPCQVMSNFLESFKGWIKSFKTQDINVLLTKVDRWIEKEVAAAKTKGFRGKVYGLIDRQETVHELCKAHRTVDDIIRMVDRLINSRTGPIFATIHKAKGLEHENVYLLRPDLLPAIYAESKEQMVQEDNLKYVAITRAKNVLTFGHSPL